VGTGNSGYEEAGAAIWLEHCVGTDDGGEPTGHLAHRREQRKGAGGELHGLIGKAGDAAGQEGVGEVWFSSEVQVGDEEKVVTEVTVFALYRLFHLQ